MTTERPANVRVALPSDEDEIMRLMFLAYKEQPIFALNEHKMREKIRTATERKGGVIGVIDGPTGLEGYLLAEMSVFWYTDEWHLSELSNFVHPDHRATTHARDLIDFAKWFTEQLNMPLLMGILSTQRLDAKARLYRRQLRPVGAIFVSNTGHLDDALSASG